MSVWAISNTGERGPSRRSRLLAWIWPDPLETRDRDAWLAGLLGWLWPSALHDERPGRRRQGLMALLFGWAWPGEFDSALKRFWRKSWLWAWMWPGRVSGPDGEICPLAPWHPAVRPEVCEGEPWTRRVSRHGGMVFMMFAAGAIAAPTFIAGNNGALDGGRLNLFHSDPANSNPPASEGGGEGGQTGDGAGGGGTTGGGGGSDGSPGGDPSPNSNPGVPGDPGGDDGAGGGGPPSGPGPGGDPGGPGTTFLDPGPNGGGDLSPEPGLGLGGGGGSGGGGGGAGGGSGGGSGGGGGTGGDDPFTPPGGDPPIPLDPPGDKPVIPQLPGPGGPTGGENPPGGGGGGGGGGPPNAFLPFNPDPPKTDDERGPAGAVPEPATWAMMILGFGLTGYAIRRRRVAIALS